MTKDEREALRWAITSGGRWKLQLDDLLALLDAADERDRLREALVDVEEIASEQLRLGLTARHQILQTTGAALRGPTGGAP